MKSTAILFFATAILFSACNSNSAENPVKEETIANSNDGDATLIKKYGIKTATITYEAHMKAAGYEGVGKSIVYFDDYGNKERKDTYDEDGTLKETFFSDGKTLYLLIHKNKAAYKRGDAYRGTEMKFDWNGIPSEDKSSGKAKKGSNENIIGKDCEVFYHESGTGKSKFAGWQNICLLTEVQGSNVTNKIIATDIKEDPISPETFAVPADYAIQ